MPEIHPPTVPKVIFVRHFRHGLLGLTYGTPFMEREASASPVSRPSHYQGCGTGDVSAQRPGPGEHCGRGIRELDLPKGSFGDRVPRGRSAYVRLSGLTLISR